jgi:hypothetical protein
MHEAKAIYQAESAEQAKERLALWSTLTFRLNVNGCPVIILFSSTKRRMRKKGLSPCEERSGRVKFKKNPEGALLAWILPYCKSFVMRSTAVF